MSDTTKVDVLSEDGALTHEDDVCSFFAVHDDVVQRVRAEAMSVDESQDLADLFQLLSSPTRLQLLDALERHTLCVCDLADLLDSTPSAVSHQLRLLRKAGLVNYERQGKEVYYGLTEHPLLDVFRCLRAVKDR